MSDTDMEVPATSTEPVQGSGSHLYGSVHIDGNARAMLGDVYNISNIYHMVSDGLLEGQKGKKPPG